MREWRTLPIGNETMVWDVVVCPVCTMTYIVPIDTDAHCPWCKGVK